MVFILFFRRLVLVDSKGLPLIGEGLLCTGPTVDLFEEKLSEMDEKNRARYLYELCQLAFGYYEKLPLAYRKFIDAYLRHNRACYVTYLITHTALAKLRYPLSYPDLFIKALHLLEATGRQGSAPGWQLSACLTLIFIIPYTLSTLDEDLRQERHSDEDLLMLLGKIEVGRE